MKQTAVEWLIDKILQTNHLKAIFEDEIIQAKEMEKQQQGYSEEEVLNFTQTMIQQYKFGNTNIEQLDLLKESLEKFKNK
jgi:hypothetical protein